MIFLAWLGIHLSGQTVTRLLLGRDEKYERPTGEALFMMLLWYSAPLSWLLDMREPSGGGFVLGFLIYAGGVALRIWARKSNPHFQPDVVMPPEVVRTGVYRWMKHPGYAAMVAMGAGSLLMLGHVIGWFLLAAYSVLLMVRAQEEDRLIRASQVSPERTSLG